MHCRRMSLASRSSGRDARTTPARTPALLSAIPSMKHEAEVSKRIVILIFPVVAPASRRLWRDLPLLIRPAGLSWLPRFLASGGCDLGRAHGARQQLFCCGG